MNEKFEIPMTPSEARPREARPSTSAEPSCKVEVGELTKKLAERRKTVKSIREISKQNKGKLERTERKLKEKGKKITALETENKKLKA